MFTLEPLDATFGAIVHDIDLRQLDGGTWDAFHQAWIEYALLIVPGQYLAREEQDDLARRFGDLELTASPITNLDRDGTVHSDPDDELVKSIRGNEGWHHDSTYMPIQAKGAVFTAEVVPAEGSATGWADMRAAYDALDDDTRERISGLTARHSIRYSQGRAGYLPRRSATGGYDRYGYHDLEVPVRPLVKVHPETGRPNLLIGRHAHAIDGMDAEESDLLLARLSVTACQPPRIHYHQWAVGDVAIWDNRRLMHRATPFDLTEPRRMWHTRIAGDRVTEVALNHA